MTAFTPHRLTPKEIELGIEPKAIVPVDNAVQDCRDLTNVINGTIEVVTKGKYVIIIMQNMFVSAQTRIHIVEERGDHYYPVAFYVDDIELDKFLDGEFLFTTKKEIPPFLFQFREDPPGKYGQGAMMSIDDKMEVIE